MYKMQHILTKKGDQMFPAINTKCEKLYVCHEKPAFLSVQKAESCTFAMRNQVRKGEKPTKSWFLSVQNVARSITLG